MYYYQPAYTMVESWKVNEQLNQTRIALQNRFEEITIVHFEPFSYKSSKGFRNKNIPKPFC